MKRSLSLFVMILCACGPMSKKTAHDTGEALSPDWSSADPHTHVAVTTVSSDYATGSFATVSLDDWKVTDTRFLTSGDPVVAVQPSGLYQLNRFTYDTMRRYIPGAWRTPLWETHLGDRSNPHDVVECGGALFVSLYGEDRLAVHGIDDGALLGHVDLSAFDDGDGQSPEASSMRVFDERLYVGLQRLNRSEAWRPQNGAVVEVDCLSREVLRDWSVGSNALLVGPVRDEGLLVSYGAYGGESGALARLRLPEGRLETVVETPGDHLMGLAVQGDSALGISFSDDAAAYAVLCVDLAQGALRSREPTSRYLTAVHGNDRGEAWVSAGPSWLDPTAPSGLYVYDVHTCTALNDTPIEMTLHPFDLAFF